MLLALLERRKVVSVLFYVGSKFSASLRPDVSLLIKWMIESAAHCGVCIVVLQVYVVSAGARGCMPGRAEEIYWCSIRFAGARDPALWG